MADDDVELFGGVKVRVVRSGNPGLKPLEDRAVAAILKRREAEPKRVLNVNMVLDVWGTAMGLELNAQMVYSVRENLDKSFGGCAICYAVVGNDDWKGHKSGTQCPDIPLDDGTEGWESFKRTLKLPSGIICFHCFLPTVR